MQRQLAILLVAGVLLLLVAAVLSLVRAGEGWSSGLLVVAGLIWTVAVLVSWRNITQYMRRRSTRYGANAVLLSFLVLVILFLVAYMADRRAWRWDLSSTGEFTLSEKTLNVLEGIAKEIDIYVYYERAEREAVRDLLVEYSRRNRNLHVRMQDMNENPELAERFGVGEMGTLVFDAGDKRVLLRTFGEEDITNALIKVSRPGQKKLYFLGGHGEKSIAEKGIFGYSTMAQALLRENYAVATIGLLEAREVPADCDVLLVAGAKSGLADLEVQAIQRYLQRGGRLFLLFDPMFRSNLEGWVGRWGVHVGDDRVVDPSPTGQMLGRGALTPLVNRYGVHAITKQFEAPTYYQSVRSVRRLQLYSGAVEMASLAFTSPESWAETELHGTQVSFDVNDLNGPVSIAMACRLDVEGLHPELESAVAHIPGQEVRSGEALSGAGSSHGSEARIVVFGDSDFANNQGFNEMGNGNLFLNSVAWLTEDEDLIAVRAQPGRVRSVTMTVAGLRVLNWISIGVLPVSVGLAGLVATLRRRRRG